MKKSLFLIALVAIASPTVAQPNSAPPAPILSASYEVLQVEQTRDEAAIQRQHDQIAGLTRQMQDLKAPLDALQQGLGEDAAATGRAGERVKQAAKQKYGVRVLR